MRLRPAARRCGRSRRAAAIRGDDGGGGAGLVVGVEQRRQGGDGQQRHVAGQQDQGARWPSSRGRVCSSAWPVPSCCSCATNWIGGAAPANFLTASERVGPMPDDEGDRGRAQSGGGPEHALDDRPGRQSGAAPSAAGTSSACLCRPRERRCACHLVYLTNFYSFQRLRRRPCADIAQPLASQAAASPNVT